MHFHLVAVGTRMPEWVTAGFETYTKRLQGGARLKLHEIPLAKRGANPDPDRARAEEGKRLRAAIPAGALTIALEPEGRPVSTDQLAQRVRAWRRTGASVALLVGGPDGLDPDLVAQADERWSLSAMTFPHALVRVIVAEQIYRALSIVLEQPYHR